MNLLQQLAEAIGFEPAEGEDLTVPAVVEALASATPSRGVYQLVRSLNVELLDTAREELTAEAAEAEQLVRNAGLAYSERITLAENLAGAEGIPELTEPEVPAVADEPAAPPADSAETSQPVEPAAPAAGSAQPVDPPPVEVVATRGTPGQQVEVPEAQLNEAMAAALQGRQQERFDIAFAVHRDGTAGRDGVSALAAGICDDGQQFGYCGFPAIDPTLTVCGTSEWPEAAAFAALNVPRVAGQPVLRPGVFRPTNAGFVWGSTERESQLLRDEQGDLILDAEGRPQLNPDADSKGCVPVICDDATLTADTMLGQCRVIDAAYPADKVGALRQTMVNEQVRDIARATLTWMGAMAGWTTPDATLADATNLQNAAARFIDLIGKLAAQVAQPQGVSEVATDLFIPAWFPRVFNSENFLRPDYSEVWSSVNASLASMGVTVRPSLDHFVDTAFNGVAAPIATDLVAAGLSTWEVEQLAGTGTIAAPEDVSRFDLSVPLIMAASGSIIVDVEPFITVNMDGEPRANPIGQSDLLNNRRTLFTEATVFRHHDGCSPLVGTFVCLDPQGVTSLPVASGVERCTPAI